MGFNGITTEKDNGTIRLSFNGFVFEPEVNFIISVVDSNLNPVPNATVSVTIQGVETIYTSGIDGAVTLFIETQTLGIRVEANKDCLSSEVQFVDHPGVPSNVRVTLIIGELPCLSDVDTNRYNLVRWHRGDNLPYPLSTVVNTCTNCGANAYSASRQYTNARLSRDVCSYPYIVAGETLRYTINQRVTNVFTGDVQLALVDENNVEVSGSVGTVVVSPPDINGDVIVYFEWIVPNTVVAGKLYKLVIYDTNIGMALYVSNEHLCTDDTDSSVVVEYTNEQGVYYGYDFNVLPWYPSVRTLVSAIEPEIGEQRGSYTSTITGGLITQSIDTNLLYGWETERISNKDWLAWTAYASMSVLVINGVSYSVSEGVSLQGVTPKLGGARARFKTIDLEVASRNRFG